MRIILMVVLSVLNTAGQKISNKILLNGMYGGSVHDDVIENAQSIASYVLQ